MAQIILFFWQFVPQFVPQPLKKVISRPQKEVKQMDEITKKLMEIHGFSFSQLHRKLLRD